MAVDQKMLVRCFPIEWDELKSATADVVDLAKIQRCNGLSLNYHPGLDKAHRDWVKKARGEATKDPSKERAQLPPGVEHPAIYPVEIIMSQDLEGFVPPYSKMAGDLSRDRRWCREGPTLICPTVDHVIRSFQLHVESWKKSQSCRLLKSAVQQITAPERIDKMVCFGLGFVDNIAWDTNQLMRRLRSQHAAMLTIRDTLEEMIVTAGHAERNISIFVQDPSYDEWNKIVLEKHGMTVVDAQYGHHEGFLRVDRNTMVVDATRGIVNIMKPCLEFTEPVVFFQTVRPFLVDAAPHRACWMAFDRETNAPICVPGDPFPHNTEDDLRKLQDRYTVVELGDVDDGKKEDSEDHTTGFSDFHMHIRKD